MTTRTPHELAVDLEEGLQDLKSFQIISGYQGLSYKIDKVTNALEQAIEALRAQKPVDVESLKRPYQVAHMPDAHGGISEYDIVDEHTKGYNNAIDHLSTKYNLTEKE